MKTANHLERVAAIDLATYSDPARGSLTVVESLQHIPFSIARIFYMYGVPHDCERGAHAHRETEQVFIAVSGSFSLEVSNPCQRKNFAMSEPHRAVYVPPLFWARVYNFSGDAVCLVLTSALYDSTDYIRDWDEYVAVASELTK
jgi:dTDP-4-dehydrorhamnose 3,5-epimerase-like enzyme